MAFEGEHVVHPAQQEHTGQVETRNRRSDRGSAGADNELVERVLHTGGVHALSLCVDLVDPGIEQHFDPKGLDVSGLAMREILGVRYLATEIERNSTYAEIGVAVGDRHCDLPVRGQLTRSQRSTDAGVASADDEQTGHDYLSSHQDRLSRRQRSQRPRRAGHEANISTILDIWNPA